MSRIVTNARGQRFTEPEPVAGLGVDWRDYIPAFDETFLNETLLPNLEQGRTEAQRELERECAANTVRGLAREKLNQLRNAAAELVSLDRSIHGEDTPEHADTEDLLRRIRALAETNRYTPKAAVEKEADRIRADIAFLDNLYAFLCTDNTLDKLLYAFHQVELKYRKKLFKECFRRLGAVRETLRRMEKSSSTVRQVLFAKVAEIDRHVRGCRVIYDRLEVGFREMKRQIARGNLRCLENDLIGALPLRQAEAFTRQLVDAALEREQAS